jgi:murein L,D-transpeptidase YafK
VKVTRAILTCVLILTGVFANYLFLPGTTLALDMADKVLVIKGKRLLLLMRNGEVLKVYKIALGKQPEGHKNEAGDSKTPEGTYIVDSRISNSGYHLSIHISYPNQSDVLDARESGVSPGGGIMIHGLPNGLESLGKYHRIWDWTDGCIAVTNSEIEEIWRLVPDGTPVEIKP